MPAQNLQRTHESKVYCHVFNKGVANTPIFREKEDYDTFVNYLNQYLSPPSQLETNQQTFTVRGRSFKGTPHLPKNYFGQVELIAYGLEADHFHLVIFQIEEDVLQHFIKSLCTRYSIYFNKKYNRTGSLFEGPYKSVKVEDPGELTHLTRYIHIHTNPPIKDRVESYSSYPEYLGTRITSWVKPEVVLSLFDKSGNNYKSFVESYELNPQETKLLEKIAIENIHENKKINDEEVVKDEQIVLEPAVAGVKNTKQNSNSTGLYVLSKISVFTSMLFVFVILFNYGFRNVQASLSSGNINSPSPTPAVEGAKSIPETGQPPVQPTEQPKVEKPVKTLVVTVGDELTSVNIRKNPTTSSEIIGTAEEGDTFEYVSLDSDWYGVKMPDGSTGYIFAEYMKEVGGENQ